MIILASIARQAILCSKICREGPKTLGQLPKARSVVTIIDRGRSVLVCGKVVQDNNGTRFEFWYQHLLDIGCKGFAIHRTFDDPGCDHRVGAEACDEG